MVNEYCRVPQWEATRTLAAVAQGLEKAELVVRDAKLVNVCTGEVLPHTDVAVAAGRIAYVGARSTASGRTPRSSRLPGPIWPPACWTGTSMWSPP